MNLLKIAFLDELEKIAKNRSVREWRIAQNSNNAAGADQIAQASGQLGNKPRYLEDISLGGAEAGVDKMMGSAAQGGAPAALSPTQRLDQFKQNKQQLGLSDRSPTASVMQNPEGRSALLRGTQPGAAPTAPNESGYIARKMYKPDSYMTQAEFTPAHVEQKMQMTQQARALSPEAKAMVPDMYGHETKGFGPTQRTMSYHEYVPGMQDLRDKNVNAKGRTTWSEGARSNTALDNIQNKVLTPMAQKGSPMLDVTGERGTNWGNIADSKTGPKIVDFLPAAANGGGAAHASQSFVKYAPMPNMLHSAKGGGTLQHLRQEMFKPTMQSTPASGDQLMKAYAAHKAVANGETSSPASAAPAVAKTPALGNAQTSPWPSSLGAARTQAAPARPAAAPTAPAMMSPAKTAPAMPAKIPAIGALRTPTKPLTASFKAFKPMGMHL